MLRQYIENRMTEASGVLQHWKSWSHWLLWWRIDRQELERQIASYATLPIFQSARGREFLVSLLFRHCDVGCGGMPPEKSRTSACVIGDNISTINVE